MVKSGLEFILKLTEPLQSCCCPVQKYLPRMAELAWQLSRYLWRGSINFKINSRPLFIIIFQLKNDNFKTRDFSPLIERVLAGVTNEVINRDLPANNNLDFEVLITTGIRWFWGPVLSSIERIAPAVLNSFKQKPCNIMFAQ